MRPPHANVQSRPIPAPPLNNLDFLSGGRDASEFEKAKIHTKRVKRLKWVLPIVGVMVIAMFGVAMITRSLNVPGLDISSIAIDGGNLVMENPKMNGLDEKQRPYNLTAVRAIQNTENPSRVELESIVARLPMDNGVFANVTAGNGIYDTNAKTLLLGGEVFVEIDNGMKIKMLDADLDLETGRLQTSNPVTMTSNEATISSQSLLVENNGGKIVFERKVKLTLYPAKFQDKKIAASQLKQ